MACGGNGVLVGDGVRRRAGRRSGGKGSSGERGR